MPRCQPKLNFWKTRWKCTVCGARRPFNAQTQTLATIHHECGRPKPYAGPGTQLKRMLGKLGLKPEPGCPCLSRAAEMDRRGVPWVRGEHRHDRPLAERGIRPPQVAVRRVCRAHADQTSNRRRAAIGSARAACRVVKRKGRCYE